jgi:hypothetical protein
MGSAMMLTPLSAAQAQQQTGNNSVSVQAGDVTLLQNVAVEAAVAAVANVCPSVPVENITLLASNVDQRGGSSGAICRGTSGAATGPVRIVNDHR